MKFEDHAADYIDRVERQLANSLPDPQVDPRRLHEAMRYAVLSGGKRIRPLLVYATGETLGVSPDLLDPPATAIELLHTFSLIHDDLPAMDDDDLRRGKETTHRAFDEATAILAADALQPLAFQVLADSTDLQAHADTQARLIEMLAEACGSNGMTGGQALDIAAEGQALDRAELEHMYRLKTGRLLRASVLAAAYCPPCSADIKVLHTLERFIDHLGLAFQIRDDILDIEGSPAETGKRQGTDLAHEKATYPVLFGLDEAHSRTNELLERALSELGQLDAPTDGLHWLAQLIVLRKS